MILAEKGKILRHLVLQILLCLSSICRVMPLFSLNAERHHEMNKNVAKLLFAFSAISMGGTAIAQDGSEAVGKRTPAGAQKFLQMSPPDGMRFFNRSGDEWWVPVVSMASQDICITDVVFRPSSETPGAPANMTIDWHAVRAVRLDDNMIAIESKALGALSSRPYFRLAYMADGVRDRAMAAMLYLRESCDDSAATGF